MTVINHPMRRVMLRRHRLAGVDKGALGEAAPLILLGLAAVGLAIWTSR